MGQDEVLNPEDKRVRPDVLQTVLLDEIRSGIADLTKLIAKTVPQGETLFSGRTLTTAIDEEKFGIPLFSVVLSNDGPDDIEFCVNDRTGHYATVHSGETVPINMGVGMIKSLFLRALTSSSQVRLFGVY